jgi:imidazolonepropionase-like amidohydrolase
MIQRKFGPPAIMALMISLVFCSFGLGAPTDDGLALRIGLLHKGNGEVLRNALVIIKQGKIEFVGTDHLLPKGARILEYKDGVATPGFIAANAALRVSGETKDSVEISFGDYRSLRSDKVLSLNEERSEVTPEINALYSIDPRADDLARAWRSGVTCLYLAPGNLNVFNGMGTVLKTFGRSPQEMAVRNMVHLKVTFGEEPAAGVGFSLEFGLRTRRPQNRMGVDYVFRNAFVSIQNKSGVPDSSLDPQELIFRRVLRGEIPLRIRARSYLDIKAALRAMDEFGFKWILEEGVDAYRYLDDLKSRNIPVVYGPAFRPKGRFDFNVENDLYNPRTPLLLAKRGILFAFQNNSKSPLSSLRDEAIYAVRLGLDKETALKALCLNAAKILGVEDRVGTIERGKDADLLVFNGDPFDPGSRLEKVIISGQVLDPDN